MARSRTRELGGCAAVLPFLGLAACAGDVFLVLPPFSADVEAVLFAAAGRDPAPGSDERLRIYAADLAGLKGVPLRIPFQGDPDADIVALGYARSLVELQLEPGTVPRAIAGPGRALPAPRDRYAARVTSGGSAEWAEAGSTPDLDSFRIEELDWFACVGASGCAAPDSVVVEGGDVCTIPCPEPALRALDPPEPPAAPALPELTPCRPGWEARGSEAGGGWPVCAPQTFDQACPPGQSALPGDPGCTPVGEPCPEGQWPELGPETRPVIFVSRDAAPGGDGSRAAPLQTITRGLAAAPVGSGALVLVSRGTYDEAVVVPEGVELRGVCALETVLSPSGPGAVVSSAGAGVIVRDLTLRTGGVGLLAAGAGVGLTAFGVVLEGRGSEARGLVAREQATLSATRVASSGLAEAAVAEGGGTMTVEGSVVDAARLVVQASGGGARVRLIGGVVRERAAPPAEPGPCLTASRGARLELDGVLVVGCPAGGLLLTEGATAEVVESLIGGPEGGRSGFGVFAGGGSSVEVRRSRISRASGFGLGAAEGTEVVLEDVVIEDVREDGASGLDGAAIELAQSDLQARGLAVAAARFAGVFQRGGSVHLEDVTIQDLDASVASGAGGFGVAVTEGGELELVRGVVHRGRARGVWVSASEARLADLDLADILGRASDRYAGEGIVVDGRGRLTGARISIARTHTDGLWITDDGTTAMIDDLRVSDVQKSQGMDFGGKGLTAGGAAVTLHRAHFTGCEGIGVVLEGDLASLAATDLVVERAQGGLATYGQLDTVELDGARFALNEGRGIDLVRTSNLNATELVIAENGELGLSVSSGGAVTLARFRIRGHVTGPGITVDPSPGAEGGVLSIHDGEIAENRVGIHAVGSKYPARAFVDRVLFRDNEVALDLGP